MDALLELDDDRGDSRGVSVSVRVEVYALPNYFENGPRAGRSDLRSGRRKIGALHDTQDLAGAVRKLINAPGAYYAESKVGRDMVDRNVFHVELKGQNLIIGDAGAESSEAAAPSPVERRATAAPQPPQFAGASSAQSINSAADTIRAAKELIKEVAPTPRAEGLSREEAREMMRDMMSEVAAQQQTPTDPTDHLVKTVNNLKALGLIPDKPAQPAQPPDVVGQVIELMRQTRELRENIETNIGGDDEPSFLSKAGALVETLGRNAPKLAPMLPTLLATFRPNVMAGAPQGYAAGQAAPQQSAAPSLPAPVAEVLVILCENCTRNGDPEQTAAHVREWSEANKDYAPMVNEIFGMSEGEILTAVPRFLPQYGYLIKLPHAAAWVSDLKSSLFSEGDDDEEIEGADVVAHAGSSNGAGAVAAVKD
jgi:hypothetical protein